ncbi:MAG: hypothetical protein ACK5V3_00670 [Bdellovibrionales bacterium]
MKTVFDWVTEGSPLSFFTEDILSTAEFSNIKRIQSQGPININQFEKSKTHFHRWPLESSQQVLSLFSQKTEKVLLINAFDCLIPRTTGHGEIQFWPDLIILDVLKKMVREKVKTLNLNSFVYIIGESAWVRVLSAVAAQLGFANIIIVGTDHQSLLPHLLILKKNLMGIKFQSVLVQELTLQPQHAGLVFNAMNLSEQKESLQDIAYFNFMQSEGLFVNLMADSGQKLLHDEAERAQLQIINSQQIELAWWKNLNQLA